MSQRKVLIISYLFPPAGGISVQRALSLAKYLPQCGLEVHVLSARNATTPTVDPSLLKQVPAEVRVHRTFTPEAPFRVKRLIWKWVAPSTPSGAGNRAAGEAQSSSSNWKARLVDAARRLFSPDPEVVWTPFALRRARRIIKRYGIDSVVVTAPPFSALLIGNALRREFPHIQLISDFRDDWLRFFLGTSDFQKSETVRRKAIKIERETVERSSRVVLVTPSLLEETRARYPDLPASKFLCVPNGFDPALFTAFQARPHAGSHFVVTYSGTLYSTTSVRYYLDALDSLPEQIRAQVETRFVGRVAADEAAYLRNRKSKVTEVGFVPQTEALRLMEETDFLLVTMLDPSATSGKVYEYLATGKPLLAVAVEGELPQLIRDTRAGWHVDPHDQAGLAALLRQLFDPSRKLLREFRPDWEAIRRYERPRLASMFADIITEGAGESKAAWTGRRRQTTGQGDCMSDSGWCEDFSYAYYRRILAAVTSRFAPRLFREAVQLSSWTAPSVFLRHDIDISLPPAVAMAEVEREAGVVSTYMVMMESQLYDISLGDAVRMVREIAAMGHEIGVHFDCPGELRNGNGSVETIGPLILRDCARLEDALGLPVQSISFHRPIPWLLRGPLLVRGKVNAYAAELMNWYLSDSKGAWRAGQPLPLLSDASQMVLQLLTHPIWWGKEHEYPAQRLESFFRAETRDAQPENSEHFDRMLAATIPGIRRSGPTFTE